jgi:hypothetical protein
MNIIFISPHFPLHFYNFCARLKELGSNVLGIGDCPYDNISQECKNSLNEYYYLQSLENYDEVYKAVAFFAYKYGKIDYIESQNEYWLELEAKLRDDFNVPYGFRTADMDGIKHKSLMKKGYKKAGVKTARYLLGGNFAKAKKFIAEVGYPIIAKPDNGVGASNTYKISSDDELKNFFATKPDNVYIMEEFIPGHIETFDGITNSKGEILFCSGQVMAKTPLDMLNQGHENVSWTQNVQATDLYEIGKRTVAAFGTRNRFFHFEFFRLDEDKQGLANKGEIVGLEVNMRAPGGYIPDKMNFAYDVDVYKIWAESLVYGQNLSFKDYSFKRYVTHVGRGDNIPYLHTPEEVRNYFGNNLLVEKQPPKSISGGMGSYVFLYKAESFEQLKEFAAFILQRVDGTAWF